MEVEEITPKKVNERKRRRSDLVEGVITILETNTPEKRKKDDEQKTESVRETQEPSSSKEEVSKVKEPKTDNNTDKNTEIVSIKDVSDKIDLTRDDEPSSSTTDKAKSPKMTPIKIIYDNSIERKSPKPSTPKTSTPNEKASKPIRIEKVLVKDKEGINGKQKTQRRQSAKNNKSLNNSNTKKPEKPTDKKTDKVSEPTTVNNKKNIVPVKNKDANISVNEKNSVDKGTSKDVTISEINTSLATIARPNSKNVVISEDNISRMPTISHVRSLSTLAQNTYTTTSKTVTGSKTLELTIEALPNSSIFTPTSTDNVKTAKDAQCKLQKLRNETESVVGRVGVRSFARMKSPEPQNGSNNLQNEIKCEPIDLDDADRHMEKLDMMKAFELRPVNVSSQNLRDVRINKVVVTPITTHQNKAETRPKAKKSFPQPKKADEGRSELNSKNSMVYIPIQPSNTQPPVRPMRPVANGPIQVINRNSTSSNTTFGGYMTSQDH